MNKIRTLISALFGLLALVAMAVGLSWLVGPRGPLPRQQVLPAQQMSPPRTPTPRPVETPTPTMYMEPTAPSEDWPTLTPYPTRGMPTPRGTPVVKASPTPAPVPTRPPLPLTPIPEGTPPADLSSLYYVAETDTGPELRVIGIDKQGTRWSESVSAYNELTWDLWGLCPSPSGKYLAAQTTGDGRSVYIVDRSSDRVFCVLDKPIGCRGDFYGWTSDDQVLFCPLDAQPDALRAGFGIVLIDFDKGQYKELELPIDSRGYSVANNPTLNADDSKIAYSTTGWGTHESAIWIRDMSDGDEQLVHEAAGWIVALSWLPAGDQFFFLTIKGAASDPAELWLVNPDGSNARLLSQNVPKATEWRYRPTWSPDGRHIVFVLTNDPSPGTNVYVADAITGQITRLSSFEERNTGFPTWAPDGRFVAFVSTVITDEHTRYGEIWVVSVDGRQLHAVSGIARPHSALAWLPDVPFAEENEQ
jgi:Tol biopolymer transport system component